ncbi:MAG TPA: helix-turn-helix transcriptional regulator [Dehalococcoidales bacterium]|nr:helix-turn-helix transcriptional regulator [Dehalococcoidales bacterium]
MIALPDEREKRVVVMVVVIAVFISPPALLVGVRRETIVFLEQGKYNPSLRLAHNVARTLGATIEEIFTFEE